MRGASSLHLPPNRHLLASQFTPLQRYKRELSLLRADKIHIYTLFYPLAAKFLVVTRHGAL